MQGIAEALRAHRRAAKGKAEATGPAGYAVILAASWDHELGEHWGEGRHVADGLSLADAVRLAVRAQREHRAEGGTLLSWVTDAAGALIATDHH